MPTVFYRTLKLADEKMGGTARTVKGYSGRTFNAVPPQAPYMAIDFADRCNGSQA
jgi:hypothetical protein